MAVPNALNIKVGAATISINGTNVGHTLNGSEVTYEPVFHEVEVDLYGKTSAQMVLIGQKFTAKLVIAEPTHANMLVAMPFGKDNTGNVGIGKKAGALGTDVAVQLVIHPNELLTSDRSLDVVMWKAVSMAPVQIPYKNDDETKLEVTFQALVDEAKTDGNLLGLIGDSAV